MRAGAVLEPPDAGGLLEGPGVIRFGLASQCLSPPLPRARLAVPFATRSGPCAAAGLSQRARADMTGISQPTLAGGVSGQGPGHGPSTSATATPPRTLRSGPTKRCRSTAGAWTPAAAPPPAPGCGCGSATALS